MTPYSASRGIRYTAPPGPDGKRREDDEETAEPSTPEAEADGGRRGERGSSHAADERGSGTAADD